MLGPWCVLSKGWLLLGQLFVAFGTKPGLGTGEQGRGEVLVGFEVVLLAPPLGELGQRGGGGPLWARPACVGLPEGEMSPSVLKFLPQLYTENK